MTERKKLVQIASTAWEHPADRAALNTLRSIPGFDIVVRKIASFFGEVGIRQLFLANAVTYLIYVFVLVAVVRNEVRPEPIAGGYRLVLRDCSDRRPALR